MHISFEGGKIRTTEVKASFTSVHVQAAIFMWEVSNGDSKTFVPVSCQMQTKCKELIGTLTQEPVHGPSPVCRGSRTLMLLNHNHGIWGKELWGFIQEHIHGPIPIFGGSRNLMPLNHNHHIWGKDLWGFTKELKVTKRPNWKYIFFKRIIIFIFLYLFVYVH